MNYEILFVGILVSTLLTELTGIYPGGVIVPAFLALYLDQPLRLIGTLLVSALALICYHLLSRFLILFGRRRFVMMLLLASFFSILLYSVVPFFKRVGPQFQVVGIIIPGLIANTIERQGVLLTLAATAVASTATYLIVRVLTVL